MSLLDRKYWAFISYSSRDSEVATWLLKRLENYPIPAALVGTELRQGSKLPAKLRPIFRDRDELNSSANLGAVLEAALKESLYLIVLCSPNSAGSKWVNQEILEFQKMGREDEILALIIDGEPNSGDAATECFPPALRYPTEPLAGDLRKSADGRDRGFLKILSGITECGFDELFQRHKRRKRRNAIVLGVMALVALGFVGLGFGKIAESREEARQSDALAKQESERAETEAAAKARTRAVALMERAEAEEKRAPGSGLNYAVTALESDGQVTLSENYQPLLREWVGPFPLPRESVVTGFLPRDSANLQSVANVASREIPRVAGLTSATSWRLIDSATRQVVADFEESGKIQEFELTGDGRRLIVSTFDAVKLYSLDDGELLHDFGRLQNPKSISVCGQSALVVDDRKLGDESVTLRLVDLEKGSSSIVDEIPGSVVSLKLWQGGAGEFHAVVVGESKESGRFLVCFVKAVGHAWTSQFIALGGGEPLFISKKDCAKDLYRIRQRNERGETIVDLRDLSVIKVELADDQCLEGAFRAGAEICVLISESRDGGRVALSQRNINSGVVATLAGGQEFDHVLCLPDRGEVVGWNHRTSTLFHITADGEYRSKPLPAPAGRAALNPYDLVEAGSRHCLLHLADYPEAFAVVDLGSATLETRFGAVADLETALVSEESKLTALNRRGAALTTFDSLLSHEQWLEETGSSSLRMGHKVESLLGDSPDEWMAILRRGEMGTLEYGLSLNGQEPRGWAQTEHSIFLGDGVFKVGGRCCLLRTRSRAVLLSNEGSIWDREAVEVAISPKYPIVALADFDRLSLLGVDSPDPLLTVETPAKFAFSPDGESLYVLTSEVHLQDGLDTPHEVTWLLREYGMPDGELIKNTTYVRTYPSFRNAVEAQGSARLCAAQNPGIVLTSEDGEKTLVLLKDDSWKKISSWREDDYASLKVRMPLSTGGLLIGGNLDRKHFLHHIDSRGRSHALPIDATEFWSGHLPSPDGSMLLLAGVARIQIFDLQTGEVVHRDFQRRLWDGTLVSIGGGAKMQWGQSGRYLYTIRDRELLRCDLGSGTTPMFIPVEGHERPPRKGDEGDLMDFIISADEKWFLSVDEDSHVLTTQLETRVITRDELRHARRMLGKGSSGE